MQLVLEMLYVPTWWKQFFSDLIQKKFRSCHQKTKAVTRRCSVKDLFLKILQNSQENTWINVSFFDKVKAPAKVFFVNSAKIFKDIFLYRTHPKANEVFERQLQFLLLLPNQNKKERVAWKESYHGGWGDLSEVIGNQGF